MIRHRTQLVLHPLDYPLNHHRRKVLLLEHRPTFRIHNFHCSVEGLNIDGELEVDGQRVEDLQVEVGGLDVYKLVLALSFEIES